MLRLRDRLLPLAVETMVLGGSLAAGFGVKPEQAFPARLEAMLRAQGRKVAILSRGYKSKAPPRWKRWWWALSHAEEPPPRIVSDGHNILLDSEQAGDEPRADRAQRVFDGTEVTGAVIEDGNHSRPLVDGN